MGLHFAGWRCSKCTSYCVYQYLMKEFGWTFQELSYVPLNLMLFRSPISTAPRRRRVLPDLFRFSIYDPTERRGSGHLEVPIYLAVVQ